MTETKPSKLDRIRRHGENLLAIFPHATERDPVALCKKLRRLESQAAGIALRLCNGPEFEGGYDEVDKRCAAIMANVDALLGNDADKAIRVPMFINRDPRGYALKITDTWMASHKPDLERDWGGYGIIAPEIR